MQLKAEYDGDRVASPVWTHSQVAVWKMAGELSQPETRQTRERAFDVSGEGGRERLVVG
jgi:hypothetical protein